MLHPAPARYNNEDSSAPRDHTSVVPSVRIGVCVVVVGTDIKAFMSWHDLNSLTNFETILSFGNADLVVASLFWKKCEKLNN